MHRAPESASRATRGSSETLYNSCHLGSGPSSSTFNTTRGAETPRWSLQAGIPSQPPSLLRDCFMWVDGKHPCCKCLMASLEMRSQSRLEGGTPVLADESKQVQRTGDPLLLSNYYQAL